jgi:hypothetical protein
VDARVSFERKASRLSRMETSITNSNKWKKTPWQKMSQKILMVSN